MNGAKRASVIAGIALLMILPAVISGGPVYGESSARVESVARQAPVPEWVRITNNSDCDYNPALAYNSVRGEFLVVWQNDPGLPPKAIYGQRLSSAGTLVGSPFAIANAGRNEMPDVAYDPFNDRYLVAYCHYDDIDDDWDLYVRAVDGDGTVSPLGAAIDVSSSNQRYPSVAYNSQDHEYLVVYESVDVVLGRLVASDGIPMGTASTTIASSTSWWIHPDVAYDAARNQYLVVYTKPDSGAGSSHDIYGQLVSDELDLQRTEFGVCLDSSYDQLKPVVAAGPDEYLVVWDSNRPQSTPYSVYGRRVLGNGMTMGPVEGFFIGRGWKDTYRSFSDVAYVPHFTYLVVWAFPAGYPTSSSNWNTYGIYVLPGTDATCGRSFGIDTTDETQTLPAVACSPGGPCLMVEIDNFWYPSTTWYEITGWFLRWNRTFIPAALLGAR
jgi:uncharacterized protein YlbG (UPF0298 family)